jgi:plastocyanin
MKRWLLGLSTVAILTLLPTAGMAISGGDGKRGKDRTVDTKGGFDMKPNKFIRSDLRFAPGKIVVRSGREVTWRDRDDWEEPHTITVVDADELPDTVEEVFGCFDSGPCGLAEGHFTTDPPTLVLNEGAPGLDTRGDSLFLGDGEEISAVVSAAPEARLHYLCAIHPWMQGLIRVR